MTKNLFKLDPNDNWRGPFLSAYGAHLVMVVNRKDARYPALEEVRGRVAADLLTERKRERSDKAIAAIISTYTVDIDLDDKREKDLTALGGRE